MGLTVDEGSKRTPAPAGTHIAVCFGLFDLGTQEDTYQGRRLVHHKVWIWWELCNEKNAEGLPVTIGSFYTASLGEKSNLRKSLESWRGRPFTQEELRGFHLNAILGKPCMLTVMHKPKQSGGVRDLVQSITGLPKGMTAPKPVRPVLSLSLDADEFSRELFEGLPQFLKDMIFKSKEGRAVLGPLPTDHPSDGGQQGPDP